VHWLRALAAFRKKFSDALIRLVLAFDSVPDLSVETNRNKEPMSCANKSVKRSQDGVALFFLSFHSSSETFAYDKI